MIRAVQQAMNLVDSFTSAGIMAEEVTVRGLKKAKKCSTRTTRNLLARDVRLIPQRIVPGKKGKGSGAKRNVNKKNKKQKKASAAISGHW